MSQIRNTVFFQINSILLIEKPTVQNLFSDRPYLPVSPSPRPPVPPTNQGEKEPCAGSRTVYNLSFGRVDLRYVLLPGSEPGLGLVHSNHFQ